MTQPTGKHLKELREAAGMTIDELTEAVGMKDRRSMFRWHHSKWILGGKALAAVEYFQANGRTTEAAFGAITQWRGNKGYWITGLDGDAQRVTIATHASPGSALKAFRDAQNRYQNISIIAPDGVEIDGFELSNRYKREQEKINA